jgi:hypothetical protein
MSFELESIVPWGRSFGEYQAMFNLSEQDLRCRILGCGDGPASFNSSLTARGGSVVSVDPIYSFSQQDIRRRIDETYIEVIEQTRKNMDEFVWTSVKSIDELGRIRMSAMEEFLTDYPRGLVGGRYVNGELPHLLFEEGEFDLALCSHLLFLYSEQLSEDFHLSSIQELCRVATEVRIFPLLELGSKKSRHLEAVVATLSASGYAVAISSVEYEFQRGGKQMMTVRRAEQSVATDRSEDAAPAER